MALFNVRVYGILLDAEQGLLVSDEFIRGQYITKLPGGGLEIGEGTRDCLQREFLEETGLSVKVGEHIYTTDFYQLSAFNHKDQIISIYYRVHHEGPVQLEVKEQPFDFAPHQIAAVSGESEVFRWIPQEIIHPDCMTLPIDKVVMDIIRQQVR
ncbi:MAG: NUDIX domain-containing protein [Sediminibacterium sp.]